MTAVFKVGDVFDRMSELEDGSVDLILTSPPFLALRSYLPDGDPNKAKEIGSEPTPADYLDVLLRWTAECRRVLAPHGSLAVELGDSFAGAGGAGGDYDDEGMRGGQPKFDGTGRRARSALSGWPLAKSLVGVPQLYQLSLAYGRNILTGQESPAGMWRVRNVKPWIRTNPPVGALGDKERPATSYVIVACTSANRYFDLDAVRSTTYSPNTCWTKYNPTDYAARREGTGRNDSGKKFTAGMNPAGAPPRDWWHQVDAIIDAEIDRRAGKFSDGSPEPLGRGEPDGRGRNGDPGRYGGGVPGARGTHIRRALEEAGILTTLETLDISPRGYSGAHYAVWPKELVRVLIDEMCPRRVCTECGEPSRRIVETTRPTERDDHQRRKHANGERPAPGRQDRALEIGWELERSTLGWSDCGHNNYRPGLVLDPFAGSGTTLAVASGMARDSIGIDIDVRNADLARARVGMFLEVDEREATS